MAVFAIGGILSSSTVLLRFAAYIGAVVLAMNILLFFMTILDINRAFETLITLNLSYLVFFLATVSIYTARIYKNGVNRPVYIVDWRFSALDGKTELPEERYH
jgi:dolichol-phosphate mannosyltransferase